LRTYFKTSSHLFVVATFYFEKNILARGLPQVNFQDSMKYCRALVKWIPYSEVKRRPHALLPLGIKTL